MRNRQAAGYTLVDLVVTLAVLALGATLAAPPLLRASSGLVTRLAAQEIAVTLAHARAYAIRHSTKVGLKFRVAADGSVTWALYRDGDSDGVRTADIDSGVDPRLTPVRSLVHFGRTARLGFPDGAAPSDPSDPRRRLERLDDPIRFNRSDIASFSPLGGATPGSVYVTDGEHHLYVVRLNNRTSRAHLLRWNAGERRWE